MVSQNRAFERLADAVDLIHEPFLGVSRKLRVPSVVTIHDIIPKLFPDLAPRTFRYFFERVLPTVLDNADLILTDSEKTSADLSKEYHVRREKLRIVRLGANHVPSQKDPIGDDLLRERDQAEPYFLVVGTGPSKDVATAIAAFAAARGALPARMRLRIVGNPDEGIRAAAEAAGYRRGAVSFEGVIPRERLEALLRSAKALVHPAIYEGFGLVPLEAMRSGIPVITSTGGAIPEVCGSAALFHAPRDTGALTEAMINVLDRSVRNKLMLAGLARSDQFRWEDTAEATFRAYRELVDGVDEEVEWGSRTRSPAPAAT